MKSVWTDTVQMPKFEQLSGDKTTDVLIIGGGIAGLLCAHALQRAGVDYILVEANEICSGITKNTTAKITAQHGLCYDKMIRRFGVHKAKLYLTAQEHAIQKYKRLAEKIPCDFQEKRSYVYSLRDRAVLEREMAALHQLGRRAELVEHLPLPFQTAGAVCMDRQAQFHPLLFLKGIAQGLNIYEHSRVRELVGCTAHCAGGTVCAKKIIVATHFPFLNKHGSYFIKMYQSRSYVLALENAAVPDGMYIDASGKGLSFRGYENLLLLGGGSHRTGKQSCAFQTLSDIAKKYYPGATEKYRFATQDCMTLDAVPYIGQYSANTEHLYVATGFHKWGMTTAMVAAEILCDMVRGRKNQYAEVFSPSRSILRPQLAVNAAEAIMGMASFSKKRCPHVGCALKWNAQEHTWDCPCHGSRFTRDGKLIDNPATGDLKN